MGRAILAVIAGYLVLLAGVFILFTGLYVALGTDGAFQPGSYEPSMLWIVASTALAFGAAIAGGFVCKAIARRQGAVTGLVVVVIALGAVALVGEIMKERTDEVRTADVPSMEAMMKGRQPVWVSAINPLIGALGVILGARMKKTEGEGAAG